MSSQVSLVNFCALKVDAIHWCSHLFNGWHMYQNMWDVTQTNCSTFISKKLFVWNPSISGMANSKTFLASCKIRKYAVQCQCEPFCIFKCVHSRRRNFTFDLKENFPSFQCTWELSFNLFGKYAALPFNHLIFLQWIIICCDRAVERIRLSWGNLNDPFILKYPRKIYLRDCYLLDYYEFPYKHKCSCARFCLANVWGILYYCFQVATICVGAKIQLLLVLWGRISWQWAQV